MAIIEGRRCELTLVDIEFGDRTDEKVQKHNIQILHSPAEGPFRPSVATSSVGILR